MTGLDVDLIACRRCSLCQNPGDRQPGIAGARVPGHWLHLLFLALRSIEASNHGALSPISMSFQSPPFRYSYRLRVHEDLSDAFLCFRAYHSFVVRPINAT